MGIGVPVDSLVGVWVRGPVGVKVIAGVAEGWGVEEGIEAGITVAAGAEVTETTAVAGGFGVQDALTNI